MVPRGLAINIFSFARVGSLSSLFRYKKVCFDRSSVCSLACVITSDRFVGDYDRDTGRAEGVVVFLKT